MLVVVLLCLRWCCVYFSRCSACLNADCCRWSGVLGSVMWVCLCLVFICDFLFVCLLLGSCFFFGARNSSRNVWLSNWKCFLLAQFNRAVCGCAIDFDLRPYNADDSFRWIFYRRYPLNHRCFSLWPTACSLCFAPALICLFVKIVACCWARMSFWPMILFFSSKSISSRLSYNSSQKR